MDAAPPPLEHAEDAGSRGFGGWGLHLSPTERAQNAGSGGFGGWGLHLSPIERAGDARFFGSVSATNGHFAAVAEDGVFLIQIAVPLFTH